MTSNNTPRRRVSDAGLALIRAFESFSATAYTCPAGKRTIGYGHVIRDPALYCQHLTLDDAERLLIADLAPFEIYLAGVFPALDQNQFDALASFCFNVGLGAFERSTLFTLLKAGDLAGAAAQLPRWTHAGKQQLRGLVRRREAERALFLGEAK